MAQDIADHEFKLEVAQRLRVTREALGLTQDEMAESIGVGRTTYTNYEQGTRMPSPPAIARLAKRHGVTTDWIWCGDLSGMRHSLAVKIAPLLSRSFQSGG